MALINPQSLYSGAAQVFDTKSHLAFQARLLAHHQAQQEALDSYFRKLPLTINEKGVRDQERPSISKGALAIKDFWLQNKDKLRNGDDAAAYNYEKMIREQQDKVAKSQELGLTSMQVGKYKFNPNTAYMFQPKDMAEKVRLHELPADDPQHVDLNLDEVTAPPKPLVKDTYMKRYDKIKFDDDKAQVHNADGTVTVTNTPKLGEGAKNSIMSGATYDYLHDPSVTEAVNQLGAADETNPLNSVFKQNFGRDIQNPIDVTAAFITANKVPAPTTEVIKQDQLAMTKERQSFARQQQSRQFAHANAMQARGFNHTDIKEHGGDVAGADAVLHNVYDIINEGEKANSANAAAAKGTPLEGAINNLPVTIADPNLLKTFANIKKVGSTPVPPDVVSFDKAKDQFNLIYTSNGQTESIPLSGRDYVKLKVKETYPNKDIGQINNIVDKVLTKNGGLYNTIQMYNPDNQPKISTTQKPISHTKKLVIKGL